MLKQPVYIGTLQSKFLLSEPDTLNETLGAFDERFSLVFIRSIDQRRFFRKRSARIHRGNKIERVFQPISILNVSILNIKLDSYSSTVCTFINRVFSCLPLCQDFRRQTDSARDCINKLKSYFISRISSIPCITRYCSFIILVRSSK